VCVCVLLLFWTFSASPVHKTSDALQFLTSAEEIRSRYLGEMDSEWAVEDSTVPCLPMPESWTLHASANILRKEGKEAAAIELEKLAQHASGSASIPLMRRGSCQEELVCAHISRTTRITQKKNLCLSMVYGSQSQLITLYLCRRPLWRAVPRNPGISTEKTVSGQAQIHGNWRVWMTGSCMDLSDDSL
jgi:hypothetical protein